MTRGVVTVPPTPKEGSRPPGAAHAAGVKDNAKSEAAKTSTRTSRRRYMEILREGEGRRLGSPRSSPVPSDCHAVGHCVLVTTGRGARRCRTRAVRLAGQGGGRRRRR